MQATQFAELNYEQQGKGNWRFIDASTGRAIGPQYKTKAELLGDLWRFAREFGCLPFVSGHYS